jgi:hypothetical protein
MVKDEERKEKREKASINRSRFKIDERQKENPNDYLFSLP